MKKVLIDIDEVICDTTFLYYINEFLGTNYKLDDFTTYYLDEVIPDDKKDEFYDFYISHDVYEKAKLIDGAYDGLKKICELFDVYLYSSCVMFNREKKSGKLFGNKYDFVMRELPFIKPENIIFTSTKNMVLGDIQIDDRLKNLLGPVENRILFSAYHNHDLTDEELAKNNVKRVDNWDELVKYIINLNED